MLCFERYISTRFGRPTFIASACACSNTDSASVASFSPKTVIGIKLTLAQISNSTETETRFTIVRWGAIFCISILVRQQFQGNDHEFQLTLFLRFLRVLWITWLPRPPFLLKGKISSISPYTIRIQPFINLPVFANKLNSGEKLPLVTETFHTWFPVSVKFSQWPARANRGVRFWAW